ncbi:MAG: RDD family protein [Pseudomonadota bacterium]
MTTSDMYPGLPDPETHPEYYSGVAMKRGLAWCVDSVVVALLTAVGVLFTAFIGLFFLPLLFLLIGFLYRWVTISNGSATPGMRLFNIALRDRFGEPFDASAAFMHTAGYTLSMAIFPLQLISVALMLITERGQGLTDHILGTVAVNR